MPKLPKNWPSGALPRRTTCEVAAHYCGLSTATFRKYVKMGLYPQAGHDGRYDLKAIDDALDRLDASNKTPQPQPSWGVQRRKKRDDLDQTTGG